MPQIMELTPYQVRHIYFRSDRRDEPVPFYIQQKEAFWKMQKEWYNKTEEETEALWREHVAQNPALSGPGA